MNRFYPIEALIFIQEFFVFSYSLIIQYLWYSVTLTYSEPEAFSEPRHIHNSGTYRTLLYSERWHIQNLRHIQKPVYIYDEALISFTAIIIFTNCNYFRKAYHVEISVLR